MPLATKPHTAGNAIRYAVDYSDWLDRGDTLVSGTAVIKDATKTTATVDRVSVNASNQLVFYVNGGAIKDTFTVSLQITDSRTEIKNDEVNFFVIAP